MSVQQRVRSSLAACVLLAAVVLLHGSSFAADPNPADDRSDSACESAEDCYRAALVQKGPPDKAVAHEDRLLVRTDGGPASGLRSAWRTFLVWAPVLVLLVSAYRPLSATHSAISSRAKLLTPW